MALEIELVPKLINKQQKMENMTDFEKTLKKELDKIDECLNTSKDRIPNSILTLAIPMIKIDKSANMKSIIEAYCKEHDLEFAYLDCRMISSSSEIGESFVNEYGYTDMLMNGSKPVELTPKKHKGIVLIDYLSEASDNKYIDMIRVFLQTEQEIRDEEQRSTMLPIITYDQEFDSMRQSDLMYKCQVQWIEK